MVFFARRILRLWPAVSLAALTLGLLWAGLAAAGHAQAARPLAAKTLDRDLEPIVVTGAFDGLPVTQIFVYREVGGAWGQIPFQVDEVTASGSYTPTEDGLLDANDEIVFMAGDLGDQATTSITASLPIGALWYQVEVSDPLSPTKKGWAYLVSSSVLTASASTDYADYAPASRRLTSANYQLGWASNHSGQDYLSLFGSGDLLDRTKFRVRYHFQNLPNTILQLTENASAPAILLLKDGPVRAIVSRAGTVTRGYASLIETVTPVDLTSLPASIVVDEFRLSTDLTNTVPGGTYYNQNVPAGVTIDGITETVPATPFTQAWRQVSLDAGTTIQTVDLGGLAGTPTHYYKDLSVVDNTDTGDRMSYGDSGVAVLAPTTDVFTIESAQYILPGRQPNRGAEFYAFFQNPLSVTVTAFSEAGQRLFLPLIANAAAAAGPAAPIDAQVAEELAARGRTNIFIELPGDPTLGLEAAGARREAQHVADTLRDHAERSQASLRRFLDSQGVRYESFWINNSLYIYAADLPLVQALARRADVARVRADRPVPRLLPVAEETGPPAPAAAEWGVQKINADDVWAAGVTGQGVVVANIDTGVRYTHQALVRQYRGDNGDGTFSHDYNWWDPTRAFTVPTDLGGHGTHTMGTIVGGDGPGPGADDVGVAPGAQWIAARGCGLILCTEYALISAAQWVACPTRVDGAAPDCSRAPDIVNNSWGADGGDPFYRAVVRAWLAAGIAPVFSVGNSGPACRTATSPGDYRYVVGVGATDAADTLARFSSRGPGAYRWLKPDVVAPGVNIRSAFNLADDAYLALSGTSMAAPHVAGVLALMLSAHPQAGLADLYAGLTSTTVTGLGNPPGPDACAGRSFDDYPNPLYGWGRVNAWAAVNALP